MKCPVTATMVNNADDDQSADCDDARQPASRRAARLIIGQRQHRQHRSARRQGHHGGHDRYRRRQRSRQFHCQAHRCRCRAAQHDGQAGADVDHRRRAAGVAGRHQPGGDRRDDRQHQAVGDCRESARPQASTTKLGASAEISWETVRHAQRQQQGPAPRPVRRPADQRDPSSTAATRAYPGEQGPHYGDADVQVPGDRGKGPNRQQFRGDVGEGSGGQHRQLHLATRGVHGPLAYACSRCFVGTGRPHGHYSTMHCAKDPFDHQERTSRAMAR